MPYPTINTIYRFFNLVEGDFWGCKNPGPKDPALVIPRGDFVSWNLNGLWSIGVMECWSGGRTI